MKSATPRLVLSVMSSLAVLQWGPSVLRAGSFNVNPVRIELSDRQPHGMVQVTNVNSEPVTIQVQVVTWQPGGKEDVYHDSDDVLVNPPIFTLESRQTQTMRLGLRRPRAGEIELSYRLILHEVPSPRAAGTGVKTLLRVSLPIFARPSSPVAPLLAWEVQRISDRKVRLSVVNKGTAHIQIRQLWLTSGGREEPDIAQEVVSYVLPNGRREWIFESERIGHADLMTLRAQTDLGILHERLAIQSP